MKDGEHSARNDVVKVKMFLFFPLKKRKYSPYLNKRRRWACVERDREVAATAACG